MGCNFFAEHSYFLSATLSSYAPKSSALLMMPFTPLCVVIAEEKDCCPRKQIHEPALVLCTATLSRIMKCLSLHCAVVLVLSSSSWSLPSEPPELCGCSSPALALGAQWKGVVHMMNEQQELLDA